MPTLPVIADSRGLDMTALPAVAPEGLYVHVPFCFHKCHYCDFYSITRQSPERMGRFVDLVLAEADLWHRRSPLALRPRTVFFGGGTPSLLPHDAIARLLDGLRQRFDLSGVREWTVEVNPATADLSYLRMLCACGVNRVSVGAQSFDPVDLAMLERHHDPADVPRALGLAGEAGIERTSLDLIYAVPGQTLDGWLRSLEAAVALGTEHLSCYGLTYEPNTPMAVRKRLGRLRAVEEDLEVEMFGVTRRRLADAGLPSYEVSNYARTGCASLHNLGYWNGDGYLGLGPSAASHVDGWRFKNDPHLGRWEQSVAAGRLPTVELERLSPAQRWGELAMLNLRLARGIDVADFQRRTGADPRVLFDSQVRDLSAAGLIESGPSSICLTDRAWHLADAVAAEFLAVA